jgi:hypothetical protein
VLTPRKHRGSDVVTRFWIKVDEATAPSAAAVSRLGYGVTAYNLEDALALLTDRVFGGHAPPVESVVENVDVSTLDEGHIRPNMEAPTFRGVWFPKGYAQASG